MAVDKNQAIIDFLLNCPQISSNPLYFNAIQAQDNNKEIVTQTTDRAVQRPYIDGTVERQFLFTLVDFRSVTYQAIPKVAGLPSENVQEMLDVQGILDWVSEQNDNRNYPDFGEDCIVDEMFPTTDTPKLNGIDTTANPVLAKYSITIRITYLDTSKRLYNK